MTQQPFGCPQRFQFGSLIFQPLEGAAAMRCAQASKSFVKCKAKKDSKYIEEDGDTFFSKWILRARPDVHGRFLMTKGEFPGHYFTEDVLRELLSQNNSEMVRRVGMGVNLAASTIQSGLEAWERFTVLMVPAADPGQQAEAVKAAKKMRAHSFQEWLATHGSSLLHVVKYLNLSNNIDRDEFQTRMMTRKLLKLLGDRDSLEARLNSYAELADIGSRVYSTAAVLMEASALAAKQTDWAKKVPDAEKQPASVRRWLKSPEDESLLPTAVASFFSDSKDVKKPSQGCGMSDASSGSDSDDSGTISEHNYLPAFYKKAAKKNDSDSDEPPKNITNKHVTQDDSNSKAAKTNTWPNKKGSHKHDSDSEPEVRKQLLKRKAAWKGSDSDAEPEKNDKMNPVKRGREVADVRALKKRQRDSSMDEDVRRGA